MATADFNNDGNLDAALGMENRITVLLGRTGGEFSAPLVTEAPGGMLDLKAADFTRDGLADLVTVDLNGNVIQVYRGLGTGLFSPAASQNSNNFISGGSRDFGLASRLGVGDFNEDGILDIVAAASLLGSRVGVFFGASTGPGHFAFSTTSAPARFDVDVPERILVDDVDGDRHLDIVASFQILLGDGAGGFLKRAGPVSYPLPGSVQNLAIASADFNRDGLPDLAFISGGASPLTNRLSIFHQVRGGSRGVFTPAQHLDLDINQGTMEGIAIGEIDGSAPADIVLTLLADRSLGFSTAGEGFLILHGRAGGTFVAGRRYVSGEEPRFVAIRDVDRNGSNDLVIGHTGLFSQTVAVHLNRAGVFNNPPSYLMNTPSLSIASVDLDLDSNLDLAVGTLNGIAVLRGNGNGSFSAPAFNPGSPIPGPLAAGDFDGDGWPDVAELNRPTSTVFLQRGNGSGSLLQAGSKPVGLADGIAAADFNGDGISDLAVSGSIDGRFNGRGSGMTILLGNRTAQWTEGVTVPTVDGYRLRRLVVADFFGDRGPDLGLLHQFSASSTDVRSNFTLFRNRSGSGLPVFDLEKILFLHVAPKAELPWPDPSDAASADFNRDGFADLAVFRSRDLQTEVLLGNGQGDFRSIGMTPSSTSSRGMTAADLNCDGFPDAVETVMDNDALAVLTNTGAGPLGSLRLFGAQISPIDATVGDFNKDGLLDLAAINARTGAVSVLINQTACQKYALRVTPDTIILNGSSDSSDDYGENNNEGGGNGSNRTTVKAHLSLPASVRGEQVVAGSLRMNGLQARSVKAQPNGVQAEFDIAPLTYDLTRAKRRRTFDLSVTGRLQNGTYFTSFFQIDLRKDD